MPSLEVRVKTPDAERLLVGFQKIANRITTGLVLSALIVGASVLMQVDTTISNLWLPWPRHSMLSCSPLGEVYGSSAPSSSTTTKTANAAAKYRLSAIASQKLRPIASPVHSCYSWNRRAN